MRPTILIYILVMALTTYLVRMIPFTLFRKKLEKPAVKAFFDYIPYTVLSAMTFPAILSSTATILSGAAALMRTSASCAMAAASSA